MRVCIFLCIFIAGFLVPYYVVLPALALYALRYAPTYELILVGVALDLTFGTATLGIPFPLWYTVFCSVLLWLGVVVRPRLRWGE